MEPLGSGASIPVSVSPSIKDILTQFGGNMLEIIAFLFFSGYYYELKYRIILYYAIVLFFNIF